MADEELDAALVERVQRALCVRDMDRMALMHYEDQARAALLSLPIPAAALNALARGEAAVVPKVPTHEMIAASTRVHPLNYFPLEKAGRDRSDLIAAGNAASPYVAKE